MKRLGIRRVFLVPAATPPHKGPTDLVPARHRYRMVKLAVGRRAGMAVSAIEMRRPGPSYTIDTVRTFRRRFPGRPLYFIVGADTVRDIPNWHRWRDLIRTVRFVAVSRPGFTLTSLRGYAGRFLLLPCRGYRVSSAELRARLVHGVRAPELPPKVAAYIRRHRLYRPDQGAVA